MSETKFLKQILQFWLMWERSWCSPYLQDWSGTGSKGNFILEIKLPSHSITINFRWIVLEDHWTDSDDQGLILKPLGHTLRKKLVKKYFLLSEKKIGFLGKSHAPPHIWSAHIAPRSPTTIRPIDAKLWGFPNDYGRSCRMDLIH